MRKLIAAVAAFGLAVAAQAQTTVGNTSVGSLPAGGALTSADTIVGAAAGTNHFVKYTPAQFKTYLNGFYQLHDTDLDAISTAGTTSYGIGLLSVTDSASLRTALALGNVNNTADSTKSVASAAKLTSARTIAATGDAAWSISFDGSASVSSGITLATVNSSPGSCGGATAIPIIVVNAKGLVTSCTTTNIGAATTAARLTPGANINGVLFDGSAAITIPAQDTGTPRLAVANNLSDVANPAIARGNLGAAANANIQIFTAGGTWTKPTGANVVVVIAVGAGGGGGGGARGPSGTALSGGAGGGGAYWVRFESEAAILGSTETITVGAAGTAGAGAAADGAGIAGTSGGNSSFGGWLTAYGGGGGAGGGTAVASGSGGGAGSFSAGGSGSGATVGSIGNIGGVAGTNTTGGNGVTGGASGGGSAATGATPASGGSGGGMGAGGGGSGGGITTADVASAGAAGGRSVGSTTGGGAAGAIGAAGVTKAAVAQHLAGTGGGGGGSSTTAAGGIGGAGQTPGGGAGGGGSARTGFSAGNGGAGGAGQVIVITYF